MLYDLPKIITSHKNFFGGIHFREPLTMSTQVQVEVYTESFTVYSAKKVNDEKDSTDQHGHGLKLIITCIMLVPWDDRYCSSHENVANLTRSPFFPLISIDDLLRPIY
jgi:hypothetical protein